MYTPFAVFPCVFLLFWICDLNLAYVRVGKQKWRSQYMKNYSELPALFTAGSAQHPDVLPNASDMDDITNRDLVKSLYYHKPQLVKRHPYDHVGMLNRVNYFKGSKKSPYIVSEEQFARDYDTYNFLPLSKVWRLTGKNEIGVYLGPTGFEVPINISQIERYGKNYYENEYENKKKKFLVRRTKHGINSEVEKAYNKHTNKKIERTNDIKENDYKPASVMDNIVSSVRIENKKYNIFEQHYDDNAWWEEEPLIGSIPQTKRKKYRTLPRHFEGDEELAEQTLWRRIKPKEEISKKLPYGSQESTNSWQINETREKQKAQNFRSTQSINTEGKIQSDFPRLKDRKTFSLFKKSGYNVNNDMFNQVKQRMDARSKFYEPKKTRYYNRKFQYGPYMLYKHRNKGNHFFHSTIPKYYKQRKEYHGKNLK